MVNKDGIVSIGFDYKKELDEVCATIEKELNNLGGDINLSEGIKKQMTEIKKMITDMKKDIGSSFDKITETKLDTKTFESFKKDVNKRIREVSKEVTILKEQFSALDGSANVNGIVQQFANLKKYVEDSNTSISELISNSKKLGQSIKLKNKPTNSKENVDDIKKQIDSLERSLNVLDGNGMTSYKSKSVEKLKEDIIELVTNFDKVQNEYKVLFETLNDTDKSSSLFISLEKQATEYELKLAEILTRIDTIRNEIDNKGLEKYEKQLADYNNRKIVKTKSDGSVEYAKEPNYPTPIDLSDIIPLDIDEKIDALIDNGFESGVSKAKALLSELKTDLNSISNKPEKTELNGVSNNIELHISTKQSTINKQLDEMIDNLQQRATNKPIIAPVKLRVDSEYEKTTKDASASALTENQINEARKDIESVVPGLEKAFNNSMRIATNKAVETAKESIKAVREFFESNPITVHLTVPDDEKAKIGKAILSEDGKTTVNISGEVDKARKSVKGLSEDLEKSQLLIKENAQNAKNLSLEKLVNSLSETMSQFSELKGIISSIQNMENTIARVSGISSTNELVEQWNIVEKTIINATKLDGDFRKNANIGKIVSEYQKYIDMGGTNSLSGIDKIKDNELTINSILSKMKELKSQDVENDSIQKLSVDLDGVIAKFDELISTVKTATNALYKIIRQGSVSDLDKQWSSISNKFKSIADESGKINLSKQKTDIKELMDMYQKYTNAGGTNSLMSLTDNVETLRKLDKEYQKLNQTQTVDNSSTIEKESESFKKVEKSVDSLTTAIGGTKVQAINIEATAMEDAAEREIIAIRSILDNLDLIVSRLKDIKGIKLPKIEVKNVDVVEKAVESLANAGNKSNISSPTEDIFQGDDKAITDASTTAIKEESKALEQVSTSAKEASESKEKFAKANKEVKASADSSKTSISEEEKYFNSLGNTIKSYDNTLTTISRKPADGNRSKELQDKIDIISSSLVELRALESNASKDGYIFNEEDINRGKQLEQTIKNNIEAVKQMSSAQKGSDALSRGKEIDTITKYLNKFTGISKQAKQELNGLLKQLQSGDPSVNVKKIHERFLELTVAEREAGREARNLFDIFNDKKLYSFLGQAASMFSFYDLVNLGREGFQTIRELDTALTEMRKVSDESVESLKRYQAATFDVGDAVGATAKTIQNSTADWMRLGESIDEAAESAKTSNILLNVSEFESIDEATKSLVSMSQAYQELEKIDIVDKLNNIGNNYSIATDELATGLQNAAAVLKTQGNDLDKAIALVTAGNAITQDASKTSAGIRTIALRIAGTEEAKEELQELGEDVDDFVVKTASKTQQIIKDYTSVASNAYKGVDVLDANGNLRDTYDILLDIAKVYKEIQAEDKKFGTNRANALVEELAGKNRSNIASSILLNPDLLENVYKSSQNSAGSAQAELNKYLDSIDGRMTQLENRAQEFWYKVIDSDTIKNGITLLTDLLELGTDIIDTFGVLPTIMTGVGAGLAVKNVGINTLVVY